MQPTDQYILWSREKGGWFSKSAFTHSDYRQAQVFTEDNAIEMCKLHSGRLIPVDRAFYLRSIEGINLDQR